MIKVGDIIFEHKRKPPSWKEYKVISVSEARLMLNSGTKLAMPFKDGCRALGSKGFNTTYHLSSEASNQNYLKHQLINQIEQMPDFLQKLSIPLLEEIIKELNA